MRTARKLVTVMGGGQTYEQRVLALEPVAYWPLDDAAGSSQAREVVNGWTTIDCDGVTFGADGIGDGKTAATVGNVVNDGFQLPHASMAATFPKDEGTFLVWLKLGAAAWTDGKQHTIACLLGSDATGTFYLEKSTTNYRLRYHRRGNSVTVRVDVDVSNADWFLFAQTWSVSGNALKGYVNGVQVGTTATNVQTWGAVTLAGAYLGRQPSGAGTGGVMAHAALFGRALTDEELLNLATRPGGG